MQQMHPTTEPLLQLASQPKLCYPELGCHRGADDNATSVLEWPDWQSPQGYAIIGGVYGVTGYLAYGDKRVRELMIGYVDNQHRGPLVYMDLANGNNRYLGTLYSVYRTGIEATFHAMTGSLAFVAVHKMGNNIDLVFREIISIYRGASPPEKPQDSVSGRHDELRKRSRFGCAPATVQRPFTPTYAPVGWDIKLTCRKYRTNNRDEDLIHAGRIAMYQLITANADVTTFTIYDPINLEAHARCTMEYEHHSDNTGECPYLLPGDADGPWCRGCARAPHHVDWSVY